MKLLLDRYDRTARLAVTYLVFSPAVVIVVALALGTDQWWSKLGAVLAACGAPFLAAQWGRSAGRRRESELFESWGGAPTTRLLRFQSDDARVIVERRHETVEHATSIVLPTESEEVADPANADAIYSNAVAALRELTRDQEAFPLVFGENLSYGFRRNLWGRKPVGLAISAIAAVTAVAVLVAALLGHGPRFTVSAVVAAVYAAAALLVWRFTITPDWVKEAADAYAQRLIESAVRVPTD